MHFYIFHIQDYTSLLLTRNVSLNITAYYSLILNFLLYWAIFKKANVHMSTLLLLKLRAVTLQAKIIFIFLVTMSHAYILRTKPRPSEYIVNLKFHDNLACIGNCMYRQTAEFSIVLSGRLDLILVFKEL